MDNPPASLRTPEPVGVSQIIERRGTQVAFRLVLLAVMLIFFQEYAPRAAMVWVAAAYGTVQLWESFCLPRLASRLSGRGYTAVALVTMTASAFAFGSPVMIWGFHSGLLGLLCGSYLLAGCTLNSLLMTKGCRSAFIASVSPFLIYMVSSAALVVGTRWGAGALFKVIIASGAMSLSAVKLWASASQTHRSEAAALSDLSRREVDLAAAVATADAANRAKSEFLANMSHEVRTPLNGVVAVADMLTRCNLEPKAKEMAEIIRASGDTLQRLLSDILDLARIESGKIDIESAPFHAGDMIRSVAGLSRLKCDEAGVRLVVEVAPEIEAVVVGDAVRVRQVLANLLSNAVKFTQAGEVRLLAERREGVIVRFCVCDTGIGFAPTEKSKVLGRFEQADSSITRRFGGTGLGLSICCDLARLMGGVLDCESAPGVGSKFWVDLPLEAVATGAHLAPAVDTVIPGGEGGCLRILMADDHPTNRKVLQLMLDDGVAQLSMAEDGAQAVGLFHSQAFDLILMDMQMPVMDGLAALREIRRLEGAHGWRRTPTIMLTANAMPEHIAAALAAGADLHLAKPFTATDLFEAMDMAIGMQIETSQVAA